MPRARACCRRLRMSARLAGCGGAGRLLNFAQHAVARGTEETAARAGVAGDAALIDQQQQRVAVAVDAQLDEALHVSRAFALAPQLLAGSRPVADSAGAERLR